MIFLRKSKPRGFALCVGLNSVDPVHYGGWSGDLRGCENDARCMEGLLRAKGYATQLLLTEQATSAEVVRRIKALQQAAVSGDIVVVTNSSHGGQIRDYDGNEADGYDETICMYDRQLIDDELNALWAGFAKGVRLLFVSDSCHSGTASRAIQQPSSAFRAVRMVPANISLQTERENSDLYKQVKADARPKASAPIKASLLALGACQDNQTAMDGAVNGAFTGALLMCLGVYPTATLGKLIAQTRAALPSTQSPSYVYGGARSDAFEKSAAFSI